MYHGNRKCWDNRNLLSIIESTSACIQQYVPVDVTRSGFVGEDTGDLYSS